MNSREFLLVKLDCIIKVSSLQTNPLLNLKFFRKKLLYSLSIIFSINVPFWCPKWILRKSWLWRLHLLSTQKVWPIIMHSIFETFVKLEIAMAELKIVLGKFCTHPHPSNYKTLAILKVTYLSQRASFFSSQERF